MVSYSPQDDPDLLPSGIPADAWAVASPFMQQALRALLLLVAHLQQENTALRQRVADLEARLNQHSQNSSKPPSSDPPSAPPRPARVPRVGRLATSFREGALDRDTLQAAMEPLQQALHGLLEQGHGSAMHPRACVRNCWCTRMRSGRSCAKKTSSRRTMLPNKCCVPPCCGVRGVSAHTASPVESNSVIS
jgi:hypothetical protein